jgi:8-oxo-dGTP diphosphatase
MAGAVRVSVGVLTRGSQILICQRKADAQHGLKWEFPGGKAKAGEDAAACLQRELQEELGVQATIGAPMLRKQHTYPNGLRVALTFFHVPSYTGVVRNRVFEALAWVEPQRLPSYDFLAGDRDFITALAGGAWQRLFAQTA